MICFDNLVIVPSTLKMVVNHRKYTRAIFAKAGILFLIFSLSEAHSEAPQRVSQSMFSGSTTSRGLVYRGREILNEQQNTILEWKVDPKRNPSSTITFRFSTRKTSFNENGIIVLGLSKTGLVYGADVVALIPSAGGGELPKLVDMYGENNSTIIPDSVQNWKLGSANQNSSHVYFVVSRMLDTGDQQDVPINNDMLRIIWGYTEANTGRNEALMFTPEGSIPEYILDPRVPSPAPSPRLKAHRMSRKFLVPPRRTTYWCTIHRGPELTKKHHGIGFTPYFKDDISRQHVHHTFIHYCIAPPGIDPASVFEKYVGHPGEECYLEDRHELPIPFCTEILLGFAYGTKSFNLPSDIGNVAGDNRNEYFMFEVHYDNPEIRSDLVVENGVDVLYTPDLRPKDASIMFIGTGIFGMYLVPPHAENFKIAGQCSEACTLQMIPPSGVQIIALILHSHSTTRKMVIRHFRGNRELPWVQSDNNYDHIYQNVRLLPKPATVLAGDHLAVECEMDTSSRNGTTLAGFAAGDEMCLAIIVLNKRLPYTYCTSEYPTKKIMAKYGITNMTWTRISKERIVNAARNRKFVGQPLSRVIDEIEGKWTPARVRHLEREQMYGHHEGACPATTLIARAGYILQTVDDLTGSLFPGRNLVEQITPSIRSISTRLDLWNKVISLARNFGR